MSRLRDRFHWKIKTTTGTVGNDCCCIAATADKDCCGDERKRVGFPPSRESQGTLRSTQVPWLAIR